MKWTPTKEHYAAWTRVRIPFQQQTKSWCQQNYPESSWWYCWMTGNFYFEDPHVATEFVLRFGYLWTKR